MEASGQDREHLESDAADYYESFLAGDWEFAREIRYLQEGRLVGVETQSTGIDLDQFVVYPQPAQWQSGARPAGHNDLQVVASVVQQET